MSVKPDQPTLEEDLDHMIRLGVGRRVLAWLVKRGYEVCPVRDTVEQTYYALGEIHSAKELDALLKSINVEAWLIMQRDIAEGLYEPKSTVPRDSD
jgi:hypothetical protein